MPLPRAVLEARDASRRRRERAARAEDRLRQIKALETMQRVFQEKGPADKSLLVQKYASKWVKKVSLGRAKGSPGLLSRGGEGTIEVGAPVITRAATMQNLTVRQKRRKSQGRLENMKRLRELRKRRSASKIKSVGSGASKQANSPDMTARSPPSDISPPRRSRRSLVHSKSAASGLHVDVSLDRIITNAMFKVAVLPHRHTLKCDRRERVCTIEGFTERETVVLQMSERSGAVIPGIHEISWYSFLPPASNGTQQLVGSGKEYRLRAEDVGRHITAVVSLSTGAKVQTSSVGPVIPGPASIDKIIVEKCPGMDNCCVCKVDYWGGIEGDSTYRWIAVREDGSRETLVEERVCPISLFGKLNPSEPRLNDPRFYFLKAGDIGSKIKVSYRPIRDDGWRGELKTSKALHV